MKKFLLFASAVALLASCSKDLTEDVVAPVTGKSTIFATYDGGVDTRTVATPDGTKFKFTWEDGDALGVFNYSVKDDAVEDDAANVYFGFADKKGDNAAEFKGDLEFLADGNYVGYYPYEKGREIEDEVITLNIPAVQNYRFSSDVPEFDKVAGSFAANVAPAVAYGEATEDGKLDLTFYSVATYLRIPIKGYGKVKSIKLEIGQEKIAGNFTVNVADIATATKAADIESDIQGLDGTDITLNCGKGVALDTQNPTYFWFVVPAGLELQNQEVKITINGEDEKTRTLAYAEAKTTAPNTPVNMWADENNTPWTWVEGDAYVITNKYDFIKYAYAATYGVTGAPEEMVNGSDLRPAKIVVSPLDFTGYDPDEDIKVSQADNYSAFDKAVIKAYAENGGVVTIGAGNAAVQYSIEGDVEGGEPAELIALKVVGNGLFGGKAKAGNVVKNITLTNIEVEGDYLVADYAIGTDVAPNNQLTAFKTFEDITVKDCKVTVKPVADAKPEDKVTPAVVNHVYTLKLDAVKVEGELPEGAVYANELRVNSNVDEPMDDTLTFNSVVAASTSNGFIVTVKDEAAAKKFIAVIDHEASGTHWFSVVEREAAAAAAAAAAAPAVKTSFWTGFVAGADNGDDIYTAEEMAQELATKPSVEIELTNNVDMMGKVWPASQTLETATVDGAEKFAISNVVVTEVVKEGATPTSDYYYTLFGQKADVKDITLENITIDVVAKAKDAYIATLANNTINVKGDNGNVTVKGLTINVPEDATVKASIIGGLYRNLSVSGAEIDMTGILNGTVDFAKGGENYGDALFGYIAGRLSIAANNKAVSILGKTDVPTPFAQIWVNVTNIADGVHGTDMTFAGLTADQVKEGNVKLNLNVSDVVENHTLWVYFGDSKEAAFYIKASTAAKN